MQTVKEWLESRGRKFPAADKDGVISGDKYAAAGLPMVIACAFCGTTMVLTENRTCDDDGRIYCDSCY